MSKRARDTSSSPTPENRVALTAVLKREVAGLKTGAIQNAILNSAYFYTIATDENGIIQIFNTGAERMLGYAAGEVVNKITPADIADPQELIARAKTLSAELATAIKPGFEALVFKASRGIEDIYELTYLRKDGSRHPVMVSVTVLCDTQGAVIGYLLVGTDNTVHQQAETEKKRLREIQEESKQKLKQAQINLQMSEEKLSVTLSSIDDAVITTDVAGRVTLLNLLAQQLTGWSQSEALGRPVAEVFRIIDQETRQTSLMLPAMETLAHGTAQCMASRTLLIARDGTEHAIADSCAPICTGDGQVVGAVLIFRDVNEENAAQQALQDSAALVRSILDTVADGIITIQAYGGLIETVNAAAENMFGYSAAEMVGENFNRLVPELDRDPSQTSLEYYRGSAEAQTGFGRRVVGQRKDGSIFPMEVQVNEMWLGGQRFFIGVLRDITMRTQVEAERALLDKRLHDQQAYNQTLIESNIEALFGAARDITERRRLDRVLQYRNAELEVARAAADKANLAKSDFLSKMSHELHTPLNAILGFAQLLEAGSPPPTEGQAIRLQQIIKAGWYLLELINEILDLAVIESGKMSLSARAVLLFDILMECRAMVESDAKKRGIRLNFIPFDQTWFVYADYKRVKQVLLNLLSNAIKYNRKQGTVEVKCTVSAERIRISVKDSGAGLPPETIAQLFQPFNCLGQESGNAQGTGIGLVMAKQLVELMGGSIGVESTVGEGSEFWIELVWDTAIHHELENRLPDPGHSCAYLGSQRFTLLHIEDNPANLLLVEHIMEYHPEVRLLSATDGKLGAALARAHLPDVILMDINLPGISGIEALNILRGDPATAHIPVVAVSANAMQGDIEKGLEYGFFRYLTEPLKVNELMSALDGALKLSEKDLKHSEKSKN